MEDELKDIVLNLTKLGNQYQLTSERIKELYTNMLIKATLDYRRNR